MQIFREIRPFLRTLTVYNLANFVGIAPPMIWQNVLHAIAAFLPFFSLFATVSINCRYTYTHISDISGLAQHISIILCITQILIGHASLTWKNHKVIEAIDRMQIIMEKRRLCSPFLFEVGP